MKAEISDDEMCFHHTKNNVHDTNFSTIGGCVVNWEIVCAGTPDRIMSPHNCPGYITIGAIRRYRKRNGLESGD